MPWAGVGSGPGFLFYKAFAASSTSKALRRNGYSGVCTTIW